MKNVKGWFLILLCLCCTACYSLDVQYQQGEYPVAFGQHLAGFEVVEKRGYLRETLWVYHAGGLGPLPIGPEGLTPTNIWSQTFQKHLHTGEGIQYLKIRQRQTFLTLFIRALTLGLLSPTEIQIEGEIVRIVPTHERKEKK